MKLIDVKPEGFVGRLLDTAMTPLMYALQGTVSESPQRTHKWNNRRLSEEEMLGLNVTHMVRCDGDLQASSLHRFGLPLFHIPILGGWRRFAVIAPIHDGSTWYPGWFYPGRWGGFSRIPLYGQVRLLLGPEEVHFFGLSEYGQQILVKRVAVGYIGEAGEYRSVPLR